MMSKYHRNSRAHCLRLATILLLTPAGSAFSGEEVKCEALKGKAIGGAKIVDAVVVPAKQVEATRYTEAGTAPTYCKVHVLIPPKLNYELRMPLEWNGRLHYSGSGGYAGMIRPVNPAVLAQGYADVASDTGHSSDLPGFEKMSDASFAVDDPTAVLQLAQLGVPTVTVSAKEVVTAYYGRPAEQTYFEGCSNGGREGVMSALRFPLLFDGIIAGAPGIEEADVWAFTHYVDQFIYKPGAVPNKAKLKTLNDAVLKACDTVEADGLVDGIVSNWEACQFDPSTLRCPNGKDTGDNCLSDPQLDVINALTSPHSMARGKLNFGGYPLTGTQGLPGEWDYWEFTLPKPGERPVAHRRTGPGSIKYFFARDLNADVDNWDFDEQHLIAGALRDLFNVEDPNLQSFMLAGGKLMMWTGAGDPTTGVRGVVDYYKAVRAAVGAEASDDFMRLYVLGGVSHCRGGPGADKVNTLLPALDAWVTKNEVPESLSATKTDPESKKVLFSRPMCNYPAYPRYKGEGDVNDASSFSCVTE